MYANKYKMKYWGLKRTKKNDDSDDEEDDDSKVKICKNHIYFYSDVAPKAILKLNQAIDDLNEPGKMYPEIFIHINSYGGYVYDALSAVDRIVASETPVTTIIEGIAASAATMISICADHRQIRPNSVMLIHQLRGGTYGKKCDLDDEYKNLNRLEKRLTSLYQEHTTLSKKKLKEMMSKELEYEPDDCVKYGLVDEILTRKRKRDD